MVRVHEKTPQRVTAINSTGECCDALIDGWTRDRPRPKNVRLDPDGAYVWNAMLDVITGLNLDVQVTPPEGLWHLSVGGIVQLLVQRSPSLYSMDEARVSARAVCLNTAGTSHNRLLKRGGLTPFQLLFGNKPGESLDPERERLDLTSCTAERFVRQKSAYKACLEAGAEHRVSRAQNMRTRNHQHWPSGTRIKYWRADVDRSGVAQLASSQGGETRTKTKRGWLGPAVVLCQER